MIVTIGLGSNIGDRKKHLEWALKELCRQHGPLLKKSSLYETIALLPPRLVEAWNFPFLNIVIQLECKISPEKLLISLKEMEKSRGRKKSIKWAPRPLDLDILLFGEEVISTSSLKVPHPEIKNRNFILTPLKEIQPSLKIPGLHKTVLELSYSLPSKLPTWMHILNITPDSFSDGGQLNQNKFAIVLKELEKHFIPILDLGAESTRPGAEPVSPEEEWQRLEPYLTYFFKFYKTNTFRPKISVDTRHVSTARKAYERGVDIINDVGGLSEEMLDFLSETSVEYILMHSVTVPADFKKILPLDKNPVEEIKKWLDKKLNSLQKKRKVSLDRIIFDPGIGFGKNKDQSLYILKNLGEFKEFPVRILIGHSRKSFMQNFSPQKASDRDPEGAGISLALLQEGVDIFRVHNAPFQARVARGFLSVEK